MVYNLNGKAIKISDEEIAHNMKVLDISKEEAVQMFLEDEGYLDNEEQDALDTKAKAVKVETGAEKKKATVRKPKERKPDEFKDNFVEKLQNWLVSEGFSDAKVTTVGKKVDFSADGQKFTLDLVRHREKKAEK